MIGKTLQDVLEENKVNVNELAKRINVSNQTLYSIIRRDNMKIDFELLLKICETLNVSVERFYSESTFQNEARISQSTTTPFNQGEISHLNKYRELDLYGKEAVDSVLDVESRRLQAFRAELESSHDLEYVDFLYFETAVSAGAGEPLNENEYEKSIWIPKEKIPENADYCLRINGDSMEPDYSDGEIVFVQEVEDCVGVGEIGIFVFNGEGYIKELGDKKLISLNSEYDPIAIHRHDSVRCLGRVLKKA